MRGFGTKGLTLAHLVCEGVEAIPRAFGEEAPGTTVLLVSEPAGPSYDARTLIAPAEAGIAIGGVTAIPRSQGRFRLLFALLQAWHDRRSGSDVPLARVADLVRLDESGTLEAKDIHTLLHDMRKEIGPQADEIVERQGKKGVRVGAPYRVAGFDLNDELAEFKDRVRIDRQNRRSPVHDRTGAGVRFK